MRTRWIQAALIALTGFLVFLAMNGYGLWLNGKNVDMKLGYEGLALVILLVYIGSIKWIERRRVSDFAIHGSISAIALGSIVGIGLFSIVIAVLWAMKVYRFESWGAIGLMEMGSMILFWLAVAVKEEIISRALVMRFCTKIFGSWIALFLSSAFFASLHLAKPGMTYAAFTGVFLAGILIGATYVITRQLWVPIGFHFGWNFAEGTLYGTQVSGSTDLGNSLINGSLHGPVLWSGGPFGAEASLPALIALGVVSLLLLWMIWEFHFATSPIWKSE